MSFTRRDGAIYRHGNLQHGADDLKSAGVMVSGNPFSANLFPAGVSIDASGVARCTGFVGMVTVEATSPMDPNMPVSQMNMNTMNVAGMAQLTCP